MATVIVKINPAIKADSVIIHTESGHAKFLSGLTYEVDSSLLAKTNNQGVPYLVTTMGDDDGSIYDFQYTPTINYSIDTGVDDADTANVDELTSVLSTLIADLRSRGYING